MWSVNHFITSGGNVYAWFDASRPETLITQTTSSVDYVNRWSSLVAGSTRYFELASLSRRPYYLKSGVVGHPCVMFDHSNSEANCDYLSGASFGSWNTGSFALNIVVACRQTGPTVRAATGDTTENQMMVVGWNGAHAGIYLGSNASGSQTSVVGTWWNNGATSNLTPGSYLNSTGKLSAVWQTINGITSGNFYQTMYPYNYKTVVTSTTLTNRRTYAASNLKLGTAETTSTTFAWPLYGEIHEVIFISGNISNATKKKALEYLRAKWGP